MGYGLNYGFFQEGLLGTRFTRMIENEVIDISKAGRLGKNFL